MQKVPLQISALKMNGYASRGGNSVKSVLPPFSEKGSTLKGKNLLLWEQILFF